MTTNALFEKSSAGKSERFRLPYRFFGKAVLGAVAIAGVLSVALVAPNALQIVRALKRYDAKKSKRYQSPAYVRKEVEKLRRKKMITVFERDGETMVRLTDKGRQELLRYQLKEKKLERRRWDGKWRLIIFDIAEKRRGVRDRVRQEMLSFGFQRLQDSVWVYPYECEQVVTLLKADNKVGKDLLYIVAGEIENSAWLEKRFHLK